MSNLESSPTHDEEMTSAPETPLDSKWQRARQFGEPGAPTTIAAVDSSDDEIIDSNHKIGTFSYFTSLQPKSPVLLVDHN